ncbi:MAG: large subunit ribosomal protein [Acidobacteriota bacterium]|jgi:large subunit ribosomal protein L3|nr:large subunit ribosomal protein [Acidobacteriota bacterium]
MEGILGKKLGMTQIYAADGTAVPVTVIQAGPCLVVQRKTVETDGYDAVQIGLVEDKPAKKVGRPREGHFKKAGVAPVRRVVELPLDAGDDPNPGDSVDVSIFAEKEWVDVIGTSKGKGFQGVMKRHGFRGGAGSHGSMFHRAPGSIGQSAYPSRVMPGMRGTGRMGGERVTVKNLQVIKVDAEQNLIYVRGAVPGPKSGYLQIRRAKRG